MKTKLLLFSAMAFVMLCFNGCTPEEVQTTQDQFKPLVLKVTLANPIHEATGDVEGSTSANFLGVDWGYGFQSLDGSIPNQVGETQIAFNTTSMSNTPLVIQVGYVDVAFNPITYFCNTVTTEVIFDGQVIYSQSRDLGSEDGTCGDGFEWNINITLP